MISVRAMNLRPTADDLACSGANDIPQSTPCQRTGLDEMGPFRTVSDKFFLAIAEPESNGRAWWLNDSWQMMRRPLGNSLQWIHARSIQ
jgi:hypothetical protein